MTVQRLVLARHGESAGNVAAATAELSGRDRLELALRDSDVPLTDLGEQQADALGDALGSLPHPIGSAWASPYLRASDTARRALAHLGAQPPLRIDERLRDRELGILDLLSSHGVEHLHPEEAARRRRLGKFWYRPPGGESWADVALRLRSLLPEILEGPGDDPVLIVAHDVVVTLVVYVLCGMSETEVMDLAATRVVGNATLTTVNRGPGGWAIEEFADTRHLDEADVPATSHSHEEDAADVI